MKNNWLSFDLFILQYAIFREGEPKLNFQLNSAELRALDIVCFFFLLAIDGKSLTAVVVGCSLWNI